MKRCLYLLLFLGCLLTSSKLFAQTIQIKSFDATSKYAAGSGLVLQLELGGVFQNNNNQFILQLSDANGNWSTLSSLTYIQGFYIPNISGVIPAGLPSGSGYKLRVVSTNPAITSAETAPFEIVSSGTASVPTISFPGQTFHINCLDKNYFGFLNNSTDAKSATINALINNFDANYEYAISLITFAPTYQVTPLSRFGDAFNIPNNLTVGNYAIEIKKTHRTTNITSINTYNYLFNTGNTSLGNTSSENICTTNSFNINVDLNNIKTNYPGSYYSFDFGDGSPIIYKTHAELLINPTLSHAYNIATCDANPANNINGYYKVSTFLYNQGVGSGVNPNSSSCNQFAINGNGKFAQVKVSTQPIANFEGPNAVCLNSSASYRNTTLGGKWSNDGAVCSTSSNVRWTWKPPGNTEFYLIPTAYYNNPNKDLIIPPNELSIAGIWEIKLEANNPEGCIDATQKVMSVCVETPPQPDFDFIYGAQVVPSNSTLCINTTPAPTLILKNKSNTLTSACSYAFYEWSVSPSTGANLSNSNALEPTLSFTASGKYTVTLKITNSCSPAGITFSKVISVVGPPSISNFVYAAESCEPLPKEINFNTHTYNANFAADANLQYNWTITGGVAGLDYEYLDGTSQTSKYPKIKFYSYGTYTAKVDFNNGCESVSSATQTLVFNQPLIASFTANSSTTDISVCTGSVITLQGTISGPAGYTYQWIASGNAGGTLTPLSTNPASPSATYTPVSADDDKQLTFTLRVSYPTPVPATCTSPVVQSIKVTYTATNTAANSTINRCTGTPVNFTPVSTLSGSQFIWTVLSKGPNISGANANLVYAPGPINDVLVNTGASPEAVVYQITPRSANGCDGAPFNLTVNVLPVIRDNQIGNAQTICVNQVPALLGQATGTTLAGGDGVNYVYLWEQRVGNTTWLTATGVSNLATYQAPALTLTTEYRRKVYSPDTLACVNESDPIIITVNPLPAITLAAVPDVCNTATSFTVPFSNPQNNPNSFSIVPGTRVMPGFVSVSNVSFSTSPLIVTIPANVAQGTYDFKLIFKNANGCESEQKTISLNVKTPPTPSQAGANQINCQNGSFTLNGNSPTSGSGIWSIPGQSNGAVIANPSNPRSTVSGLQVGKSVTLRWTITNGPCIESYSDVVLTNEPATTVSNAGIAQRNCNNGSFTLNANTPALNETGLWSLVSGTATLPADLTTPSINITGVPAGQSATLKWTISNLACSSTANITLTNLNPIANNVISFTGAEPCAAQSINVLGALPTGGNGGVYVSDFNYTWQYKNSLGAWDDLGVTTQNLSNYVVNSTLTLRRLVSSYECSSTSNELTITVLPAVSNTITGTQTICYNTLPAELTGNLPSGGNGTYTYQWQSSLNSSSGFTDISGAVAQNYQPGNLTVTTYFRRVVKSGSCDAPSGNVVVMVNPKPAMNGLSDKAYCAATLVNLAAFTSTPGSNTTYRWTNSNVAIGLAAGGNGAIPTFTTANTLKEPVEGLITVIPTYTANGVACDGDAATFKIKVLPSINIAAIANQVVCIGTTLPAFTPSTDASNIPAGATISYRWTISGSGVSIGNGSGSQIPAISTTNTGTTELEAIVTIVPVYNYASISCDGVPTSYKITVRPNPSVANAGADVKICDTSYQLNANDPVVGTGTWTQVSGPAANIVNAALYNTRVTGLQPGYRYEFQWTITNSPCATSNFSKVKVDVLSPIVNTIKIDISTVCAGETVILSTNALSGGDVPSVYAGSYTFQWQSSVDGVNNWQLISGTAETLSINPTSDLYIRRLVKSYNICEQASPAIWVRVNPATPEANAGPDQILCNLTQTQLQADNPGTFVGTWTDITPGGSTLTFTNPNLFNTAINGLVANQTYTLKWTITGLAPCPDDDDTVTITVRPAITLADAGADAKLCDQNSTNNSFVLSANTPRSFETGTWTITNQPNGSNARFDNLNNPSAKILNLIPGRYTLLWTITNDANACTPSSKSMILDVYAVPVSGTLQTSVAEVCDTGNAGTLTLAGFTGDIQQWEWSEDNINWNIVSRTANTYNFTNLTKTTYYRVKVVSTGLAAGCTSFVYSPTQTLVVYPASVGGNTAIALGNATVCEGDNRGNITLNAQVGAVVRWEYSTDGGVSWTAIANTAGFTNYTYSNLLISTQFRAVVQSGVCTSANSSVTLINVLPPVTPARTVNAEVCNVSSAFLQGNTPVNGQGTWTQVAGPAVSIADIHLPNSEVTGLVPGTYRFTWTIDNGVCSPSSATQTLTNYPELINEIQTTSSTICSGQTASLINKTYSGGNGVYSFQWQTSTDNVNWNAPVSGEINPDLSAVLTGSLYFRRTISSGPCLSISNSVFITVQPPIANNIISGPAEVCIQKPVPLITGSTPSGADGVYTYQWQSRTASSAWADISGALNLDLQPVPISENTWYRRIVRSALCTGPQQNISNELALQVRFNSIADFRASKTVSCLPFNLSSVITVRPYPDLNATYEWFANNVSIGTGADFPGYTITTDGTKVEIKLITTSRYGCDTDEKIIEFETIKSVVAGFTKSTAQGCGPLSVIFTNTSTPLAGAGYDWDFGNGQRSALVNPGSITFQPHPLNRDTTYVIKLKAYTDCQETFFTDSVLVRPKPVSIFTPDVTEGCSPLKVNFSNQSKGFPATYEFDFGDGSPVVVTNSLDALEHTFTVLTATTFTVSLKVTNECGTSTSSYNIRVRPNTVTANLVVNGNDKQGCPPHTVTFYNNSVGANQFIWDFGDGTPVVTNAALTMTHTFLRGGSYLVKLTATNGCSSRQTTELINVYPEPVSSFTTSKNRYCKGQVISFQNTSESGDYVWSFGDGNTSTLANPSHYYTVPGNYTVMLTTSVTQADGTKCSKTVTRIIEILPLPAPYFTSNAAAFNCAPFHLILQNDSQYADKFYWYIDGVLVSSERTPTDLWINTPGRTVTLKLVAENAEGCPVSTDQQINMYPRAEASFNVLPDEIIKIPNYTFNFQNTSTGNPISYSWNFGDGSTSTLANPSHTYAEIGVYPVRLIVNNAEGCPDTLIRNVEIQTVPGYLYVPNAFEPGSLVPELKIFKPKGSGIAQYTIKIFNKMGMLIWESTQLDENGSPLEGWDGMMNGQPAPPDVYVWSIEATFINKSVWKGMQYPSTDRPKTIGSIHLIR